MGKARKKPVEIEYLTFDELWNIKQTHDNKVEGAPNIPYEKISIHWDPFKHFFIETLEGRMFMSDADVLIIGVQGEIYPCKINIFNQTYDILKGGE